MKYFAVPFSQETPDNICFNPDNLMPAYTEQMSITLDQIQYLYAEHGVTLPFDWSVQKLIASLMYYDVFSKQDGTYFDQIASTYDCIAIIPKTKLKDVIAFKETLDNTVSTSSSLFDSLCELFAKFCVAIADRVVNISTSISVQENKPIESLDIDYFAIPYNDHEPIDPVICFDENHIIEAKWDQSEIKMCQIEQLYKMYNVNMNTKWTYDDFTHNISTNTTKDDFPFVFNKMAIIPEVYLKGIKYLTESIWNLNTPDRDDTLHRLFQSYIEKIASEIIDIR